MSSHDRPERGSPDPGSLSILNDIALPAAVMAAAVLLVFPGLFDATYHSRLALYPLLGALLILAGRHRLSVRHLCVLAALTVVPVVSILWAAIPVQSVVPAVRWFSFGLMIAGFGAIGWNGRRREILFVVLICAACAAAVLFLLEGDDYPAGNPNRLGAMLAVSVVAMVSGASGIRGILRIAMTSLLLVGLWASDFYIGWIATAAGSAWFVLGRRLPRLHPGWLLLVMSAGQVAYTLFPGIAGRIPPTLELRTAIWRTSVEIAADGFPLGTGTGQARIRIYTEGPAVLRELGGEERRIDFLHSDLLTLPVESGILGLLLLGTFALWILKTRFTPASGALLVAAWPFLASDLPLATPLGALPIALVLAATLTTGSRRIGTGYVPPAILIMISLFWAQTVIRGYSALGKGHREALYGNITSPLASLESATRLIPFEERSFLYLSRARMDSGDPFGAMESIDHFCGMYPSYWRGWILNGEIKGSLGMTEDAATAFLMAVRTSPEGLAERPLLALNALAVPPDDQQDLLLLAEVIARGTETGFLPPPIEGVAMDWIFRAADLAAWTMRNDPRLGEIIWLEVFTYINCSKDVIPSERYPELYGILDYAEQSPDSLIRTEAGRTRMVLYMYANHLQWTPE